MTNGWDDADPVLQDDGSGTQYELAVRFTANAGITISAVRVWAGNSVNVPSRNARLWTTGGSVLATIDIDDTLPFPGYTTYTLATPVDIASGASFDVSYSTVRYYGATAGGYPNNSSDNNVTSISGRFNTTMGLFPNSATATYYGIDIVYSLSSANQPPQFTGMTVANSGLVVQANVNVTDETPGTVTLLWDWGDGNTSSTGGGITTASHTYAAGGLYAVMATATDSGGLQDSIAHAVSLSTSLTTSENEQWLDDILDAVVSDAQLSGYFDKVNTHEPKRKPGSGLTAAVWVQSIDPIPLASGLASTSARIVFMLRIYSNMLKEPQDAIDPEVIKALSNLMRRYHDDFDFGGVIRNIDLLGSYGVALAAQAGYLEIDGTNFRIMDLTVPCLVNDVWPQVN